MCERSRERRGCVWWWRLTAKLGHLIDIMLNVTEAGEGSQAVEWQGCFLEVTLWWWGGEWLESVLSLGRGRGTWISADGNEAIIWRKPGFVSMSRLRIGMTAKGIQSECVGEKGGRKVCVSLGAKFQCAETTQSNSCRKHWGPAGRLLHPDWCRQGALCWKAERQSICVRSSSQKANALPRGAGAVVPRSHHLHPLRRRRRGAGWGGARSSPAQLPARLRRGS